MKLTNNSAFKTGITQIRGFEFKNAELYKTKRQLTENKVNLRATNRLINLFAGSNLTNVLNLMERVNLKENDYLYRPEEQIKYLYFPETALISEFQMLEDGKIIETAMTGKEGMTKPLALLNSKASTNWSQVTLGGIALRIKLQNLREAFNENNSLQTLIFNYLQESVEQCSNRIICNTFHLLTERFCTWLLMIQDRVNTNILPLTHEKAARFLGAYRPNVSVAAKSLQDSKIIKYERGQITIVNHDRLEECACACYSLNKRTDI